MIEQKKIWFWQKLPYRKKKKLSDKRDETFWRRRKFCPAKYFVQMKIFTLFDWVEQIGDRDKKQNYSQKNYEKSFIIPILQKKCLESFFRLFSKHTIRPLPQFSRTLSVAVNNLFDLWWFQQQRHRFVFSGRWVQCQRFCTLQQLQWNQMFVSFISNSFVEILHARHSTLQKILIFCMCVKKNKLKKLFIPFVARIRTRSKSKKNIRLRTTIQYERYNYFYSVASKIYFHTSRHLGSSLVWTKFRCNVGKI